MIGTKRGEGSCEAGYGTPYDDYLGPECVALVRGAVVVGMSSPYDNLVKLELEDGRTLNLALGAGCCSHSYYTDVKQFHELLGAAIQNVEEREGRIDRLEDQKDEDGWYVGEVTMKWHFLVFTTSAGHVTIDWRNDSNGYYDGEVKWSLSESGAS